MQHRWSPDGLVLRWRNARDAFFVSLGQRTGRHFLLTWCFISLILAFSGFALIHYADSVIARVATTNSRSTFKLCILFVSVSLAHLVLAPIFQSVSAPLRRWIWVASLLLTGFIATFSFKENSLVEISISFFLLILEYLFFLGVFRGTQTLSVRWRLGILFLVTVALSWVSVQMYSYVGFLNQNWYFVHSRWFMVFSYIAVENFLKPGSANPDSFFARFSLTNFLDPVPIRRGDWRIHTAVDPVLFFRAAFDLASCYAAAFLLLRLEILNYHKLVWIGTEGILNYLVLFLISYITIVLPIGILRLYGFRLADAVSMPLLAANPYERWRRWNTYYYQWFYAMVFWPVLKRSKNILLTCIAVFLMTFWFHASNLLLLWTTPDWNSAVANSLLRYFSFFMSHALVVYVGLKLNRYWPKGGELRGWLGVFVTWVLMIAVHLIKW